MNTIPRFTKSKTIPIALGLLALSALPMTAVAVPFQNGSFESPGLDTGQMSIETPGDAPTGWVGGGNLGGYALFYEQSNAWDLASQSGVANVGFGGNSTAGATIEQTFDTVPGTTYTVGYYTSAQQLGNGPQSYLAQALAGATVLGTQSGDIPDDAVAWAFHSFAFVATGTSSMLRFTDTSDGGAADNDNWALDTVTVSSVPEPGPAAMLAAGLAALVLHRRRRAQR